MRMTSLAGLCALALVACSTSSPTATAPAVTEWDPRPAVEVMAEFGLKGHMAADCATPFGQGHARFAPRPDGTVLITSYTARGFGVQNTTPTPTHALRAARRGENELLVRTLLNGMPIVTRYTRANGVYRLMGSYMENGRVLFEDGVDGGYAYKPIRACGD